MGLLGVGLLFLRIRRGLIFLILCAPILAVATFFGAAPAAYPDVEPAATMLLRCIAAPPFGDLPLFTLWSGVENRASDIKSQIDAVPVSPQRGSNLNLDQLARGCTSDCSKYGDPDDGLNVIANRTRHFKLLVIEHEEGHLTKR